MRSLRIASDLPPQDALGWLHEAPGGALAFVVTSAKGTVLRVTPTPDARALLDAALSRAQVETGALRVLAWQSEGLVAVGAPVAIVGASAASRKDALRAVDLLLEGLKGVATRTDV